MNFILIIILGIVAYLTLALDHIWPDKRTKKYKKARFVLMFVIAVAVIFNIVVSYSNEQYINSMQESINNLQSEVATLEQQNKMLFMLERMHLNIIIDYDSLKLKYPLGYFLFSSDNNIVIPSSHLLKSVFTVDWDSSKIKSVDDSFIHIYFKSFFYHPNNITFEHLHVVLERYTGSVAFGIIMNKIGMFVELIDDQLDEIIYVIGFKAIPSSPRIMDPDPNVVNYINEHNIDGLLIRLDTNIREYLKIEHWILASGWKQVKK